MSPVRIRSTDGVQVALHDLGGSGPPLLLVHAAGFSGRVYEPLATELVAGFHLWALDMRAHGESTPSDALRWHQMADDVLAASSWFDRPIAVFGHSMGGACALLAEARSPGTIRWAYLYEPVVFPRGFVSPIAPRVHAATRRRRTRFPSRAEAMVRFASRPPLNVLRADVLLAYVDHGFTHAADGTIALRCSPEREVAVLEGNGSVTFEDLRGLSVPVVIGAGDPGLSSPAALADRQAEALGHARIDRHPTLGHLGPLQDPAAIAAAVAAAARP